MSLDKKLCVVCAWRRFCKKKFRSSMISLNCPDFTRDWNIKKSEEDYRDFKTEKK